MTRCYFLIRIYIGRMQYKMTLLDVMETPERLTAFGNKDIKKMIEIVDSHALHEEFCDLLVKNNLVEPLLHEVDEVPDLLFIWCESLKSINIPDNIDTIGLEAFHDCANLEEVTILNPNIYIQHNAFKSDFNLKVLNIPKKFTNFSGPTLEEVFKLVDLDKVQINYI